MIDKYCQACKDTQAKLKPADVEFNGWFLCYGCIDKYFPAIKSEISTKTKRQTLWSRVKMFFKTL